MNPFVIYGTAIGLQDQRRLVFQIIDPTYKISMTWEVTSAEYKAGKVSRGFLNRFIKLQGETLVSLYEAFEGNADITRIWVGPQFVIVYAPEDRFADIEQHIMDAMQKALGKFDFEKVDEMDLSFIGDLMLLEHAAHEPVA